MNFSEYIESIFLEEKKMSAAELNKVRIYRKKRARDPELKKKLKKQAICLAKLKPGEHKSCRLGDTTPKRIDKKRSRAAIIGAKSRT